jgi:hypothetical protein
MATAQKAYNSFFSESTFYHQIARAAYPSSSVTFTINSIYKSMGTRQLNHWENVLIALLLYSGNPVGKKLLSKVVFSIGLGSDIITYLKNNFSEDRF